MNVHLNCILEQQHEKKNQESKNSASECFICAEYICIKNVYNKKEKKPTILLMKIWSQSMGDGDGDVGYTVLFRLRYVLYMPHKQQ